MIPHKLFHCEDREAAIDFIAAHPFAAVAVNGEQGPVTALVPLVVNDKGEMLIGHVSKSNPFWQAANKTGAKAIALFRGADAYVTPSLYPSKKRHGRVAPTWDYLALQVRGEIMVETNPEAMRPFLTILTDRMEARQDTPWKVSDAPDDYTEKMTQAIIGFKLKIDDITYVRKLSQHKKPEDSDGVKTAFESSNDPAQNRLAKEMKEDN